MTSVRASSEYVRFDARAGLPPAVPGAATLRPPAGEIPYAASRAAAAVHVIDIEEELRTHLCELFRSVGLEARAYADFGTFEGAPRADVPACLIVDARLPAMRGICLEAQLRPLCRKLPIVVTARRADVAMAVEAMKAGAVDFLEKPFRDQDMLEAAGAAIALDRDRRLARSREAGLRARYDTLTRREREVMALVTAGRLNKQVAGDLALSEITVKVHRGSAMRKMGARTVVDLVRMADALAEPGGPPAAEARLLRIRN
jgi:FixJ family two-component response regulator